MASVKKKKSKSQKEEVVAKKRGRPAKAEKASTKTKSKTKSSKSAKTTKPKTKVKAKAKTPATRTRKPLDIKAIDERFTKTSLNEYLELVTGVEKKDVRKVLAGLEKVMLGSVMKKGRREFMLPGIMKVVTKDIPARKAKKGINPFTKEPCVFKARPASIRVKVRPMKKLKDAAQM